MPLVDVSKGLYKPLPNLAVFGEKRLLGASIDVSREFLESFLGRRGMGEENRIASRHRVLKGARIHFGGGSIDCTVRNISATGAALEVTSPLGIPTAFTLVTDGDHRPCRVVWRKERRIGVTFDKENGREKNQV
jgi:hypothetical protein